MRTTLALCWVSLLAAYAAHAEIPPSGPDLRCLLVGMRLSSATDPQQKSAGLMLTSYFYAKLDQTSTKELEDALAMEAFDMSPSDFKFELGRCGGILKEKAQTIKAIGADLTKRRQEIIEHQGSTDAPSPTPNDK